MPIHNTRILPATGIPLLDVSAAAACLVSGGLVLYPTETYYALGCLANDAIAVEKVYTIKARQKSHPLPMVAANLEQVAQLCPLDALPDSLLRFWPGPLTLLLPSKSHSGIAPQLANPEGQVAIRVSSHPLVHKLCMATQFPLTSSSANISGCPPARTADALTDDLLAHMIGQTPNSGVLAPETDRDIPAGGLPSTIVRPLGNRRLIVLRQGAISLQTLQAAGFSCTTDAHATP